MFFTGISRHLKPHARIRGWGDNKARGLDEAARLAHALAAAEHLPIGHVMARETADRAEDWYAHSILKTVAVYGTEASGAEARVAAGAESRYSDLHVKREDFARYLAWMRSVW